MSDVFEFIKEATHSAFNTILYVFKENLLNIITCMNALLPFGMYFLGQHDFSLKNEFTVSGGLLVPMATFTLIYYLRYLANKIGKGYTIPVPNKRFTEVDDDGEVSIEHDRLQELILYVADIEDWLERKDML